MGSKDPRTIVFKPGSSAQRFEDAVKPDKYGHSKPLPVTEFHKYGLAQFGNGSGWARDDGGLGKKYKLHKPKDSGGRIVAVGTVGWAEPAFDGSIAQEVYGYHKDRPCVVLAISTKIEMDHKAGRKHSYRPVESCDEFQPMSKSVNIAKRSHCQNCAKTNMRFDAKILGYTVSVTAGTVDYRGTCVGCYWHDPIAFNASLVLVGKQRK